MKQYVVKYTRPIDGKELWLNSTDGFLTFRGDEMNVFDEGVLPRIKRMVKRFGVQNIEYIEFLG